MLGVGLSIPQIAVRGGAAAAPAFDPGTLFAASEAGGYYDPSDLSTLWQDTGGTVAVTADGQSVARMDDKSGNGNHVTRGTASQRPVWKTGGYLLADGVDDLLESSTTAMAQVTTVALGVRRVSGTASRNFFDGITQRQALLNSSGTTAAIFSGSTVVNVGTMNNGTDYVFYTEFNGASSYGRLNQTQSANVNPGTNALEGIVLFTFVPGSGHINARMYQAVVIDRALNSTERDDLENYIAGKAGVTL